MNDFATNYPALSAAVGGFETRVLSLKKQAPTAEFIKDYVATAKQFLHLVTSTRKEQLQEAGSDKLVVGAYYKA